jgi:hypothetical protein
MPPAPSATPGITPGPTSGAIEVTSAAQAAAIVLASNPRFAGIGPLLPDVVGQSAWYEAFADVDGYTVAVTIGSGDCQAGCINRRTWTYLVSESAQVRLVSEEGDEVEWSGNPGTGPATVEIRLSAGPICPVVQDPPDPNCADRAVANTEVVLRKPSGEEVTRGVSDANGLVAFSVPANAYYAEAAPVEGFMGQAEPVAFWAVGGSSVRISLTYDTGIR